MKIFSSHWNNVRVQRNLVTIIEFSVFCAHNLDERHSVSFICYSYTSK